MWLHQLPIAGSKEELKSWSTLGTIQLHVNTPWPIKHQHFIKKETKQRHAGWRQFNENGETNHHYKKRQHKETKQRQQKILDTDEKHQINNKKQSWFSEREKLWPDQLKQENQGFPDTWLLRWQTAKCLGNHDRPRERPGDQNNNAKKSWLWLIALVNVLIKKFPDCDWLNKKNCKWKVCDSFERSNILRILTPKFAKVTRQNAYLSIDTRFETWSRNKHCSKC